MGHEVAPRVTHHTAAPQLVMVGYASDRCLDSLSKTRADANPPYELSKVRRPLILQFLAHLNVGAPEVDAACMVDRALADHLGEQEIREPLDLDRCQRRRRVGHLEATGTQIVQLE